MTESRPSHWQSASPSHGWRILQVPVTGMRRLKVCSDTSHYHFAISKQIKMMSSVSMHPLSDMFLQNAIQAGEEVEQCPSCKEALHSFEKFHVESIKNIGVEPSNEVRLAKMEFALNTKIQTMQNENKIMRDANKALTNKVSTLASDITPLLLRRAVNVAVQAALVIAGVQPKDPIPPSNRFRNLMSSHDDFQAMFQRVSSLDKKGALIKSAQIDSMVRSRNQIEHPTDLVKFKNEVVEMVSVLERYKSQEADHKTALWVLRRYKAMLKTDGSF